MTDTDKLEAICRDFLTAIGEDPNRDGLVDTPTRFAKHWAEFVDYDAGTTDTAFESSTNGQMVCVKGIRVWSFCEHHILPFWCDVSMGYIPDGKILGLSKFARIAHQHAHGLQVQERLVNQIADHLRTVTATDDVAVYATGVHTCMCMRGIRADGSMSSGAFHGIFKSAGDNYRQEFFQVINERPSWP
jgi:GTP cyclohydrolase IA